MRSPFIWNGTDVQSLASGGIKSSTGGPVSELASVAISASAIDWSAGNVFTKTLAANTTFTFSNTAEKTIVVAVTNTTSNRTVTWPTVKWAGGVAPTQTVGAKTDIYTFIKIGSTIYGSVVQNMS
jgi:hypothetical protein